jgi:hypothetical protein
VGNEHGSLVQLYFSQYSSTVCYIRVATTESDVMSLSSE